MSKEDCQKVSGLVNNMVIKGYCTFWWYDAMIWVNNTDKLYPRRVEGKTICN